MIAGNVIHLLGIDVISSTPVIDIKPYIPLYDSPCSLVTSVTATETISMKQREQQHCVGDSPAGLSVLPVLPAVEMNGCGSSSDSAAEDLSSLITSYQMHDSSQNIVKPEVSVAEWITDSVQQSLFVVFTARAEQQLNQFDSLSQDPKFQLRRLANASELRSALSAVLQADPRSVYRRKHCEHQLYYMTVDIAHVTCWFDDDTVEVLKVQSVLALPKENENT